MRVGAARVAVFDLDADDADPATLDPEERRRADAFRHAIDRRRFIGARVQVRALLARELGCAPAAVRIATDDHGKPFLPDAPRLAFNLSHSRGVALCAIADGVPLGCDIEYRDPALACPKVAARLFAPAEVAALMALPADQWVAGFFNVWTRKEAFVKGLGLGLSYPLDAFTVSVASETTPRLDAVQTGWSLHSFAPLQEYQAAVATGPQAIIATRTFQATSLR